MPELAKLLADEQLASWARIALEAIPGPAADEALRKAPDSLKGKLLVGTINSIGVRRDAGAVDPLTAPLEGPGRRRRLGRGRGAWDASATPPRPRRCGNRWPARAKPVRSAVAEGCILCAERLLADGKTAEAAEIYDEVRKADVPKQRDLEATRGAILARKTDGIPLLIEQLRSPDKGLFQIGLSTARELPGPRSRRCPGGRVGSRDARNARRCCCTRLADRNDAVVSPAVLEAAKKRRQAGAHRGHRRRRPLGRRLQPVRRCWRSPPTPTRSCRKRPRRRWPACRARR